MLRSLAPFALISALVLSDANAQAEPPHHLVIVALPNGEAHQKLIGMDLDLVACHGLDARAGHAEVIATDADVAALEAAGLEFEVEIRNLEEHYERELSQYGPFPDTLTPPLGQGAMGGHWTFDQCVAILDQFALDYPGLCASKVSLGQTVEGRDIWMVKISDNVDVDENEPEALFDALHHAREPLSMETTLLFMDQLLSGYGTDPEATYIVDNRELFFVPVVNPDGYERNRATNPNGGGMWRKNRNGSGTDLNRNYASFWGLPGSSSSPGSSTYRGSAAFSELETQALNNFAASRNFVQVVTCHSYTDVLLTPFGYQTQWPVNQAPYVRVGQIATAQTGIAVTPFSVGLGYLGSGTAQDHHHAAHGSVSWTPELGRLSEGGFWPNPTNTVNIATRHANMFRKIALLAGSSLADAEIMLMSNGVLGSNASVGMLGHPGAVAILAASAGTANISVPGVSGNLLLDPLTTVAAPGQTFGSSGYLTFDFTIPNNPALSGGVIHWQLLHALGGQLTLGNRETLNLQ